MMQTLWGSAKWIILMISLSRSLNERASKEHSSESARFLALCDPCSKPQFLASCAALEICDMPSSRQPS